MGRSVSTPSGAIAVAYRRIDEETTQCDDWQYDVVEPIREQARALWPSFEDCDDWLGREDNAILENAHAYVGVSEYCGLLAIWLIDDHGSETPELAEHWCNQISDKFLKEFGELHKIGTFSNGESVFEAATSE